MKRIFSIFLLSLIVFNTIGYYGVLMMMEQQLSTRMSQKIDENSAEISGDLMLTVPMDLPYPGYTGKSENYERVDGQIVYGGQVYRLVKQKYFENNLYIILIRDDKSTEVREVMDEYSKTFTNQQPENSDSAVKIVVSFAKYYLPTDFEPQPANSGWNRSLNFDSFAVNYTSADAGPVFQPPRLS